MTIGSKIELTQKISHFFANKPKIVAEVLVGFFNFVFQLEKRYPLIFYSRKDGKISSTPFLSHLFILLNKNGFIITPPPTSLKKKDLNINFNCDLFWRFEFLVGT